MCSGGRKRDAGEEWQKPEPGWQRQEGAVAEGHHKVKGSLLLFEGRREFICLSADRKEMKMQEKDL